MASSSSQENESSSQKLKLVVDSAQQKVIFAEAGKDAVDLLFNIFALPVGEVVRLLTKEESMVGSLGNLYRSLETLDNAYIQVNQCKSNILTPRVASRAMAAGATLTWNNGFPPPRIYYWCQNHCGRYSDDSNAICGGCGEHMTQLMMKYVPPAADESSSAGREQGLVKGGVVTYMVMDDLAVAPMCASLSIALFKKHGVKDKDLEYMTVDFDTSKALQILNVSLQSKSSRILTDVFLVKKFKGAPPSIDL